MRYSEDPFYVRENRERVRGGHRSRVTIRESSTGELAHDERVCDRTRILVPIKQTDHRLAKICTDTLLRPLILGHTIISNHCILHTHRVLQIR